MDQQKRADYVERWARMVESQGQTRISGRIYAHLATAEEPYLSLQELADQLGVSRASVSTNTRHLIDLGMVQRVAVPGSRGEHYGLDIHGTQSMLARAAQAARLLEALAVEGVALQPRAITPGTQSLRAMSEVYARIAETIEQSTAPRKRASR
jgi:hypothetical protein